MWSRSRRGIELKTESKRTQNRLKTESKRIQNGFKTDSSADPDLPSAAFGGDGGGGTVTGINNGLRRQGEKEIERVPELLDVAAGEVGAAVTHLKERIAGEEDAVLGEIETDRAGRVAGGGEDF